MNKRDLIKSRVITTDGDILHGKEGREYLRKHRRKIVATTKDDKLRERVAKKESLIEKWGEEEYDRIVRKHGIKVIEGGDGK